MRKGTPVTFTSSSVPGRVFSGNVYDINATPTTGTLSYRARVVMPNPDDALRGGMLVSVSVRKAFSPNAIVVPLAAVVQGPERSLRIHGGQTAGPGRRRARGRTSAGGRGGRPDLRAGQARAGEARSPNRYAGSGIEPADCRRHDVITTPAGLAPG